MAPTPAGLPGSTDAWITLAGLARDTSSIRLGTLVTPATFRHPGVLAISVANVDQMSGGRVELGLGAGWYREEHEAYGLPFPDIAERFDRLAEQLEVVTGLWQTRPGERFDFAGQHVVLHDSPALPKPVQQPVPIIVGGAGRAPDAASWPLASPPSSTCRSARSSSSSSNEAGWSRRARRSDATRRRSCSPRPSPRAVGATEADASRRAAASRSSLEHLRRTGVAGTIDEAVATLQKWQDAGAERMYLQVLDLADLDHLDALAATAQ